jgi:hypothetical protein
MDKSLPKKQSSKEKSRRIIRGASGKGKYQPLSMQDAPES